MNLISRVAASFTVAAVSASSVASEPVDPSAFVLPTADVAEVKPEPQPEPEPEKKLTCVGCTQEEIKALNFFNDEGVKDRKALATILGTIKQESKFQSSVCQGGAITSYLGCTRGGFGLIQFTSSHRYWGLGRFAKSIGKEPEDFDTQLLYIVTEPEWKAVAHIFKTPGLSFRRYENAEYRWIAAGIHGARSHYARDYHNRIINA